MNDMMERVMGAMQSSGVSGLDDSWRDMSLETLARAAIAAMREPTPAMLEGENVHLLCHMCGGHLEGWYAMIDAALKEKETETC